MTALYFPSIQESEKELWIKMGPYADFDFEGMCTLSSRTCKCSNVRKRTKVLLKNVTKLISVLEKLG